MRYKKEGASAVRMDLCPTRLVRPLHLPVLSLGRVGNRPTRMEEPDLFAMRLDDKSPELHPVTKGPIATAPSFNKQIQLL